MAVTSLSQALNDALVKYLRPGITTNAAANTLRSGLVSDLADGDFVWGVRAHVVGTPTVNASNHVINLRRRGELNYTVTWPSAATVWFVR